MKLSQIPKELLAILVLVAGLIFFMVLDPPKTQCDIQIELFKKTQADFVYAQPTKSGSRPADFEKFLSRCQESNGPGGCFELFQHLKQFNHDLNAVPQQCQSSIASTNEVSRIFRQSLSVFIQLAWGFQPPLSPNMKYGWLDQSEAYLYCLIKSDFMRLYGDEGWSEIVDQNLKGLPGADKINDRNALFQLTLASHLCK